MLGSSIEVRTYNALISVCLSTGSLICIICLVIYVLAEKEHCM
jgi:hypothetical protein